MFKRGVSWILAASLFAASFFSPISAVAAEEITKADIISEGTDLPVNEESGGEGAEDTDSKAERSSEAEAFGQEFADVQEDNGEPKEESGDPEEVGELEDAVLQEETPEAEEALLAEPSEEEPQEVVVVDLSEEVLQFGGKPLEATERESEYAFLFDELDKTINGLEPDFDLTGYSFDEEEARRCIVDYLNYNPYSFVVEDVSISMDRDLDIADAYLLTYDPEAMRKTYEVEKAVDTIVSGIDDNWTEYAKFLYLHDQLCATNEYDFTFEKHSVYDALVNHTSVCDGYATSFYLLCQRAGLRANCVSSDEMDHAWNLCAIGDEAYFTDCTWDDGYDSYSDYGPSHAYFMLSVDDMYEARHGADDWYTIYKDYPSSTKFELLKSQKLDQFFGTYLFCHSTDTGELNRIELGDFSSTNILYNIPYNFTNFVYDGQNGYCADTRSIYFIDLTAMTRTCIFTLSAGQSDIGKIRLNGARIEYYLSDYTGSIDITETSGISVSSIELIADEYSFSYIGESVNLVKAVTPEGAGDITWSSTNPEAVSVEDGVITCNGYGVATIIGQSRDVRVTCRAYLNSTWQDHYEYDWSESRYFSNEGNISIKRALSAQEEDLIRSMAVAEGIRIGVELYGSFTADPNVKSIRCEPGVELRDGMKFCQECPNLTAVDLTGVVNGNKYNGMQSFENAFKECPNLRYVNFGGIDNLHIWDARWVLYNCPKLKVADFTGVEFDQLTLSNGLLLKSDNIETIYTPASVKSSLKVVIPEMYEYRDGKVGSTAYTDLMKAPVNSVLIRKGLTKPAGIKESQDLEAGIKNDSILVGRSTLVVTEGAMGSVTITSSDESVATVTASGLVTGISPGRAVITVRSAETTLYEEATVELEITVLDLPRAAAPVSSIPEGTVSRNTLAMLTSETPGAKIYYTTDGTDPTTGSILYSDPIVITAKELVIKAMAHMEGFKDSEVSTFRFSCPEDWGDVTEPELQDQFSGDSSRIPEGVWYTFGSSRYGYGNYIECGKYDGKEVISFPYTGNKITFSDRINVYQGNRRLIENRDYTVKYVNNVAAGGADSSKPPRVRLTGKGSYKNSSEFFFEITPADLSGAQLISEPAVAVNGGSKLSSVKPAVSFGGKKLTSGKDYELRIYEGSATEENLIKDSRRLAEEGKTYIADIVAKNGSNFTGRCSEPVTIKAVNPKDKTCIKMASVKARTLKIAYSGEKTELTDLLSMVKVMAGKTELVYGLDYTAELAPGTDHKSAGTHTVILRGTESGENGRYCFGSKKLTYEITGLPMKKVKVAGLSTSVEYTGEAITIDDLFKSDSVAGARGFTSVTLCEAKTGNVLIRDEDYTLDMKNSGGIGRFALTFTGKGRFSGTIKKTITVKAYNLKKDSSKTLGIVTSDAVYSKAGAIPSVVVTCNGRRLKEGVDYKQSFKNNTVINPAKPAYVVVTGIGNYTGTAFSDSFVINKANITKAVRIVLEDKIDNPKSKGGDFKSTPKLMDEGKAISVGKGKDVEPVKASDYRYYYADTHELIDPKAKVPAGTLIEVNVKVICSEKSAYISGMYRLVGYYRIIDSGRNLKNATVKLKNPEKFSFNNGKDIVPIKEQDLMVSIGKIPLTSQDYEIVSVTGNRFLGQATITIRGVGEYGGVKKIKAKITAKSIK